MLIMKVTGNGDHVRTNCEIINKQKKVINYKPVWPGTFHTTEQILVKSDRS